MSSVGLFREKVIWAGKTSKFKRRGTSGEGLTGCYEKGRRKRKKALREGGETKLTDTSDSCLKEKGQK